MKKVITYLLVLVSIFPTLCLSHDVENNVLIFVSFSMPDASLKGWMKEAKRIGAPIVVRGFINNSFQQTINKIRVLTKDNQGGIQVDPNLFKQFNIQKVPAVVVFDGRKCLTQDCLPTYNVIYGNITLGYALEKMINQHDALSPFAERALGLLKEKKHG